MRVIEKKGTGQLKSHKGLIFYLVGEKPPRNRFAPKFAWWLRHECKVWDWNFPWLRFYRGSNFRFSYWFLHGPYNTAVVMRCLWFCAVYRPTTCISLRVMKLALAEDTKMNDWRLYSVDVMLATVDHISSAYLCSWPFVLLIAALSFWTTGVAELHPTHSPMESNDFTTTLLCKLPDIIRHHCILATRIFCKTKTTYIGKYDWNVCNVRFGLFSTAHAHKTQQFETYFDQN